MAGKSMPCASILDVNPHSPSICLQVAFKFNQAEATGGDPITAAAGDSGAVSTHAAPELQRVPAAAADHATNAQA
jgi:hypothetical protein